jgi:hypothetical protein
VIYAKEIYQWLKAVYDNSSAKNELGIKQVGIGPSAIIPGPQTDEGGLKEAFPILHIAEGEGSSWDTGEQVVSQTYGVRIKYYRLLENQEEILETMSTELAKLAKVLESEMALNHLTMPEEATGERLMFDGRFQVFDETEAMLGKDTALLLGVGWFDITIKVNHII